MQTLPKPLPDELLCSALARATYRYGYWSPKRLLGVLYQQRTVVAVPDLPTNLGALVCATGERWQMDVAELAKHHTLFNYYTYYRHERQRRAVLFAMTANGGNLQLRLGVCAGSARAPKRFHLCPQCYAKDVAQFGEAYWHRAHHLPGVLVCHLHGDLLWESGVLFRTPERHVYQAVPLEIDWVTLSPLAAPQLRLEVARLVATESFALLSSEHGAASPRPDYRPELELLGWRSGRGGLAKLEGAFRDYFGAELLRSAFGRTDSPPLGWLAEVLRAPRRPMHPLKHVLMRVFLRSQAPRIEQISAHSGSHVAKSVTKRWSIYQEPELRRKAANLAATGLTTNAIASSLGVDWKTAERLLSPIPVREATAPREEGVDRQAWENHCKVNPGLGKKALRSIAPALYARLYRNDRLWLLAWSIGRERSEGVVRRIDWAERDRKLEALVSDRVASTLNEVPPRRASRSFILGSLGLRALLAHRASLLPLTVSALERECETVSAYRMRRLTSILEREGMGQAPDWKVWRRAGIATARIADGGRSLLRQARESARRTTCA